VIAMKDLRGRRGFTLIEMIIVFTMIGILVGLALPQFKNAAKKAREATLHEDLAILRKVIDQYFSDKAKYPASLQTLVDEKYLRKIVNDPITGTPDWVEVREEPSVDDLLEPGYQAGIVDVHSSSELVGMDGTVYNTW
jgi:general secretion pathway protein G